METENARKKEWLYQKVSLHRGTYAPLEKSGLPSPRIKNKTKQKTSIIVWIEPILTDMGNINPIKLRNIFLKGEWPKKKRKAGMSVGVGREIRLKFKN